MDKWTRVVLRETFMNSRSELTSVVQRMHDIVVSSQLYNTNNVAIFVGLLLQVGKE